MCIRDRPPHTSLECRHLSKYWLANRGPKTVTYGRKRFTDSDSDGLRRIRGFGCGFGIRNNTKYNSASCREFTHHKSHKLEWFVDFHDCLVVMWSCLATCQRHTSNVTCQCHMSHVKCQMSNVTCQCHMSHVTCHLSMSHVSLTYTQYTINVSNTIPAMMSVIFLNTYY